MYIDTAANKPRLPYSVTVSIVTTSMILWLRDREPLSAFDRYYIYWAFIDDEHEILFEDERSAILFGLKFSGK